MRDDWAECELNDIVIFALGGDWGKDETFEDEDFDLAYCIRGAEFKHWSTDFGKTASLRKIKKNSIEKRKLIEGDIIVEISGGGPEQPVGRTEVITQVVLNNFLNSNVICTNFLRLVRTSNHINSKFINLFLKYFYSTGKIRNYQGGSNNLRNLKFQNYLTIKIPLAPLPEQRAIVAKIETLFSDLDKGIADLQQAQKQLKIYRQAVLKKAFEGLDKSNFGEITKSLQNGISKRKGNDGDEINVLRLADITKLKIDNSSPRSILLTENEFKKYQLKSGDLLAIRVNGSIDLVGQFIYVTAKDEIEKWAFCDHLIRITLDKDKFYPKFYFYFFQLPEVRKFIHENMVSSAGQNTVSQTTIKAIPISITSLDEQKQIVREIESRLSVCEQLETTITQSLEKAQALRQSILKKAFEGKLLSQQEITACKADKDYQPASILLEQIQAEKQAQREQEKAEKARMKAEKAQAKKAKAKTPNKTAKNKSK